MNTSILVNFDGVITYNNNQKEDFVSYLPYVPSDTRPNLIAFCIPECKSSSSFLLDTVEIRARRPLIFILKYWLELLIEQIWIAIRNYSNWPFILSQCYHRHFYVIQQSNQVTFFHYDLNCKPISIKWRRDFFRCCLAHWTYLIPFLWRSHPNYQIPTFPWFYWQGLVQMTA